MNDLLNKPICISCDNNDEVVPIIYGLIYNESYDLDYLPGGCTVTQNDAEWHCRDCEIDWGPNHFRKEIFDFAFLKNYRTNGSFYFNAYDNLAVVCNAEKSSSGVYIVHGKKEEKYMLLYVGISGKMTNEGSIKIRKGGIYDRLVNGKQFGQSRKFSWKERMAIDDLDELYIQWFDTFLNNKHIPKYVEGVLLQKYYEIFFSLPPWNKEY